MVRTGRRPGESRAREDILEAAVQEFTAQGYEGASMRAIARRAGVDPALLHHYFQNKRRLFVAAMHLPIDPQEVVRGIIEGDRDHTGERLVRLFLSIWEGTDTSPFVALIRSAVSHDDAATMMRQLVETEILGPVAEQLGGAHAKLRATLAGSQMIGIIMARYIVKLEPLTTADADTLVAALAPTIQRYLTGPLGIAE